MGTYLDQNLLDAKDFSWIEETGRQPNWISMQLNKLYRSYKTDMSTLLPEPPMLSRSQLIGLSDKERLIARFDYWSTSSERKLQALNQLKNAWNEQLIGEQPFNWYNKDPRQKNQKYECAWLWYADNKNAQGRYRQLPSQFSKLEDVLTYIDSTDYTLEESLYHLEQIKKKFKSQQVAANRKDKVMLRPVPS